MRGSPPPCATLEPRTTQPPRVAALVAQQWEVCVSLSSLSPFFEINTWPTVEFFIFWTFQICPTEVEGGGGDKKKEQSNASSLRGNRKRLKERDSGRPLPWNNKNLTLTGNGSASKKSLTAPAEGQRPCSRALTGGRRRKTTEPYQSRSCGLGARGNKILGCCLGRFCQRRSRMKEFCF